MDVYECEFVNVNVSNDFGQLFYLLYIKNAFANKYIVNVFLFP